MTRARLVPRLARAAHVAVAALFVLATLARPARAQLALEGHLSLASQGMRLLSKIPNQNATEFTGNASGIDAQLYLPRYRAGLALQHLAASTAPANAGTYSATSLIALYGTRAVQAEAGLGRRAGYSDRSDRDLDATYAFYRLGGRVAAPLGTTGFSVGARGSVYLPADGDSRDGATGLDAATHLRWTSPRYPVTAALEYRSERFRVARGVEQELNVVTLSAGWAFRRAR